MCSQDVWNQETAQSYDTPGKGMFAPTVIRPTVDRRAELAGDGRALEFAIGTGRIAIPLAERGVPVTGIELSSPMIKQLRTKASQTTIPVIVGDMAAVRAPGTYTLVYIVYNAISCLLTQSEQVACFRNAARHLVPAGRFVVELWVPDLRRLPPGQHALVAQLEPDHIIVDTFEVLHKGLVSHHVTLAAGNQARLWDSPHRYISPSELDLMTQFAGFVLEARHADWVGAEFTADSQSHVSMYRLPAPQPPARS